MKGIVPGTYSGSKAGNGLCTDICDKGTDIPISETAASKKRLPEPSYHVGYMSRSSKAHLPSSEMEYHPSKKLKPLPVNNKGT